MPAAAEPVEEERRQTSAAGAADNRGRQPAQCVPLLGVPVSKKKEKVSLHIKLTKGKE